MKEWIITPELKDITKLDFVYSDIQQAISNLTVVDKNYKTDGVRIFNRDKMLQEDAKALKLHISKLEILKELSDEERKKMIPQLCAVYKVLHTLKSNPYLDSSSSQSVAISFNRIQQSCFGIGNELCQIHGLLSTARNLFEKTKPEGYLLNLKGDSTVLIEKEKGNEQSSEDAYKFLAKIKTYLKSPNIIKYLSVDELLELKAISCWMMANYVVAQEQRLSLAVSTYAQLKEINKTINANLSTREKSEYLNMNNHTAVASLIQLKTHMNSKLYFNDFWYNEHHVKELKQCREYLKFCNDFIIDPTKLSVDGLTQIKTNEEAGLALYEVPSEEERKTLVLFSFNKEGVLPYYNHFQNRSCTLGIGGLGHAPVYDQAEKCWAPLTEMLKDGKYNETNLKQVITAGFGVDGAVAQVLSFLLAKQYSSVETRTYGMGVAPYLTNDAAAKIRDQSNHYAINITLQEDSNLKVSKFSHYVASAYSKFNFQAEFEAHNRDWFMSDITGHDRRIYADKVDPAVQQPIELYQMYGELEGMAKSIADAEKTASEGLYEFMKSIK